MARVSFMLPKPTSYSSMLSGPPGVPEALEPVARDLAAGEHADGAVEPARGVAGVLERGPGDLEQDALLRIDEPGLARAVAEEGGVEAHRVGHDADRGDEPRVLNEGRIDAGGLQLLAGEERDQLAPGHESLPQSVDAGGPGNRPAMPTMAIARDSVVRVAGGAGDESMLVGEGAPSRWAARLRIVGWRNSSTMAIGRPVARSSSARTRASSNE
ncbi:hypothetical protein OV079_53055 [Nannocystis pusilla]|uniref:Uncharacterized protein n=1 Tax=Nannocystis pusilla TaxID=889268 RepID=A0A9X3F1B0_9BACT|nr:hypothetical protein [Nannocystis pusilla]MCY1014108.1 hypothetical protein [Nannocystis pusilla]